MPTALVFGTHGQRGRRGWMSRRGGRRLGVAGGGAFFDGHIFELTGFEDLAALEALHELGVLFTGHDLHARVGAGIWHRCFLAGGIRGWSRLRLVHIRSLTGNWRYFSPAWGGVKRP